MRYTKFIIKNYKGIEDLELDLNINPDSKIYTLVGLNESGKTTILEAINDYETIVPEAIRYSLIPKSKAGGFNGEVVITAIAELDQGDKEHIVTSLQKLGYKGIGEIPDRIQMHRKYQFKNSRDSGTRLEYTFNILGSKTKNATLKKIPTEDLNKIVSAIKSEIFPEIIFYRDFLTRFPEKIYLEGDESKEFIAIIEDILSSIDKSYSVESSFLDRLRIKDDTAKNAIDSVQNDMGVKVTKIVFDTWTKLQKVSHKEIVIVADAEKATNSDGTTTDRYYLTMKVKDGGQSYLISERSLGFKWFFTFILYTEFRKQRINTKGEILFLLDEPASNLHQSAQKSLLDAFKQLTDKSRLVYTTHSHHLINPLWLDNTYIIKNEGLDYSRDDDSYNANKTQISAHKYKQFVAKYPTEKSYFQPILDVLDYQPGLLEDVPNIVITEGKFDYFTFRYFSEVVLQHNKNGYKFYPGLSATKLDQPIALYESWGRPYIVILDSDRGGRAEKRRYVQAFNNSEKIFTLEDIDSKLNNIVTEELFTEDERLKITQEFNSSAEVYKKSEFNSGIQILLHTGKVPDYITQETKDRLQSILNFIDERFILSKRILAQTPTHTYN